MGDVVGSFVWIVKRDFVYRPLAVASDPAVATIRPRIIDRRTVDVLSKYRSEIEGDRGEEPMGSNCESAVAIKLS